MHARVRLLGTAVVSAVLLSLTAATGTATAAVTQSAIVSTVPGTQTPQILDSSATVTEKVLAMAQVGNRIVVAGDFSQVQDTVANGGATFNRSYVFAFDPATGAVDPAFAPVLDGVVNTVAPGADGASVYLGGSFTQLNGVGSGNLVQVSLATGTRTVFRSPVLNGAVNDLALAGGRLFVGGVFTTAGGVPHGGLASLDPTTGALDGYMGIDVALHHNYPDRGTAMGSVGVENFDVSPDGARMAVIGNFRQADGLVRDQVMMVLLQPTAAVVDPNWKTTGFAAPCNSARFDSYVRDVAFAPDGSYFAVGSTGGAYKGTDCDSLTTWNPKAVSQTVTPRWVSHSGGDTLFSVAVTGAAIYAGGHQRWMNNDFGADSAGAGAVPRPASPRTTRAPASR